MLRSRVGFVGWVAQPVYVLVELLVAAAASASYSLRDDTISALGMATCAAGHAGSAVEVCSPGHPVMNAAFVAFGLARALGAVLLRGALGAGRAGRSARSGRPWWAGVGGWAVALWVVSGVASAAVGLLPVDAHPAAHVVAAVPVFVLQPLAVLATALALHRGRTAPRAVVVAGAVVGVLTLVAAAAFGWRLGAPTWVGGLERAALWPAYLWLGAVALAVRPRAEQGS